jgi:hypothetical protein
MSGHPYIQQRLAELRIEELHAQATTARRQALVRPVARRRRRAIGQALVRIGERLACDGERVRDRSLA